MPEFTLQGRSIGLRPTREADLGFVVQTETDPENSSFISQWSEDEHRATFTNPDFAHLIIESLADPHPVGYMILRDFALPNNSVQIQRLAVAEKGHRYGPAALGLVKRLAFEHLKAHRLYLDVLSHNRRARKVYVAAGFVEEGALRDCFKEGNGYLSLVLMSMLEHEYQPQEES